MSQQARLDHVLKHASLIVTTDLLQLSAFIYFNQVIDI